MNAKGWEYIELLVTPHKGYNLSQGWCSFNKSCDPSIGHILPTEKTHPLEFKFIQIFQQ